MAEFVKRMGRPMLEPIVWLRFSRFIEECGVTGCWNWTGYITPEGYGRFNPQPGINVYAHRLSYATFIREIDEGLVIDHLCRNPICVNPNHLEMVSSRENIMRGNQSPVTLNAKKTHCKRGHPFDEKNTQRVKLGRQCRKCAAARLRAMRRGRKLGEEIVL